MRSGWLDEEYVDESKLSEEAWQQGFFRARDYSSARPVWRRNFQELRIRDIAIFALGDLKGKTVVDIGCGDGMYGRAILAAGAASYSGQDLSPKAVKEGSERAAQLGVKFDLRVGDARTLVFPDKSFDVAFSADFFEHIDLAAKRQVVAEIHRVLRPGGLFVLKTPNLDYLKLVVWAKRMGRGLRGTDPRVWIEHTRNNPDSEHMGLTTVREMRQVLEESRFHSPEFFPQPITRPGVPRPLAAVLSGRLWASEALILRTQRGLFDGL